MMTLEAVQRALADRNLKVVSDATGITYQTVWRVARGHGTGVQYETVKRLSDYLSRKV